jgi:hypothetical protein
MLQLKENEQGHDATAPRYSSGHAEATSDWPSGSPTGVQEEYDYDELSSPEPPSRTYDRNGWPQFSELSLKPSTFPWRY